MSPWKFLNTDTAAYRSVHYAARCAAEDCAANGFPLPVIELGYRMRGGDTSPAAFWFLVFGHLAGRIA